MFASPSKHKELAMAGEETFTFLARGFEFKGTLTFEGTVRIDGMVSGAIYSKGTVILGQHAVIDGDINAGTIVSSGTINGNVTATERVELKGGARITGDVEAPVIVMEAGALLDGQCRMTKDKPAEAPLDLVVPIKG